MHVLDERVLRDHEPVRELRRVVADPVGEAALLQLAEEPELAELREPHRPPPAAPGSVAALIAATPEAPARMQSAAFDASTPPIATTGTVTDMQISCEPVEPDRRGRVRLGRRRPDRAGADVGGARELGDSRLAPRRSGEAEQEPCRERPLGALVAAAEVDAVGAELERRLDVVVDDEGRVELPERPPDLDQLRRRRALEAQLDDGRARGDGGLRGREVLDDRVHSHRMRASSVSGSSAASAS